MSAERPPLDLASAALGGQVLVANDEFFAPKEALIAPDAPVFKPGLYTDRGKWMDGWETRRRREPGYDWCILRLGARGIVRAVTVDTANFTGNFPEACSIDACDLPPETAVEALTTTTAWRALVARTTLRGDAQIELAVDDRAPVTHLRLNIFPDGGVARLRVWGEAAPDWHAVIGPDGIVDVASAVLGARIVASSDMHYGSGANMLRPGPPLGMADGWETKRRRGPGHDWVVVALARPAALLEAVIDTTFFKGNAPGRCSLDVSTAATLDLVEDAWTPCLPATPVLADAVQRFPLAGSPDAVRFVRLNIYPDGGVARLRLFGRPAPEPVDARSDGVVRLNTMEPAAAAAALGACCGAVRWVDAMVSSRPFASDAHLMARAHELWWQMGEAEWLEAFAHHPRLGNTGSGSAGARDTASAWSASEQSGVSRASAEARQALAQANDAYERRFGFLFIACASGRTAEELLDALRHRLLNARPDELRVAAAEHAAIMRLRLEKLLA